MRASLVTGGRRGCRSGKHTTRRAGGRPLWMVGSQSPRRGAPVDLRTISHGRLRRLVKWLVAAPRRKTGGLRLALISGSSEPAQYPGLPDWVDTGASNSPGVSGRSGALLSLIGPSSSQDRNGYRRVEAEEVRTRIPGRAENPLVTDLPPRRHRPSFPSPSQSNGGANASGRAQGGELRNGRVPEKAA